MRPAINFIAIPLMLLTHLCLAASDKEALPRMSAIVLDFEIRGDTSIESVMLTDQKLIEKYSAFLRAELQDKKLFNVVDDAQTLAAIDELSERQYLQRCNGCELKLAAEYGATQVVVPWIERMSILIQYMILEVRDVETGEVILRKAYNFRGNNEKAWRRAISFYLRDLQKLLDQ